MRADRAKFHYTIYNWPRPDSRHSSSSSSRRSSRNERAPGSTGSARSSTASAKSQRGATSGSTATTADARDGGSASSSGSSSSAAAPAYQLYFRPSKKLPRFTVERNTWLLNLAPPPKSLALRLPPTQRTVRAKRACLAKWPEIKWAILAGGHHLLQTLVGQAVGAPVYLHATGDLNGDNVGALMVRALMGGAIAGVVIGLGAPEKLEEKGRLEQERRKNETYGLPAKDWHAWGDGFGRARGRELSKVWLPGEKCGRRVAGMFVATAVVQVAAIVYAAFGGLAAWDYGEPSMLDGILAQATGAAIVIGAALVVGFLLECGALVRYVRAARSVRESQPQAAMA